MLQRPEIAGRVLADAALLARSCPAPIPLELLPARHIARPQDQAFLRVQPRRQMRDLACRAHHHQPRRCYHGLQDGLQKTVTKIRGELECALEIGSPLLRGAVCRLEWVPPADVAQAWQVFATYRDKGWSFTDCVSRVVIDSPRHREAFAFDVHFRQFGTLTVVP